MQRLLRNQGMFLFALRVRVGSHFRRETWNEPTENQNCLGAGVYSAGGEPAYDYGSDAEYGCVFGGAEHDDQGGLLCDSGAGP